ncbi:MAG: hypothetical protein EAZ99_17080 [Alphaproteobacteria bacterium]|nr:MAG: hypothetical protein EAZ99_17080 [Alphaproteobacteria bacterium]
MSALVILYLLLSVLTDIISATLHTVLEWEEAGLLRLLREGLSVLLAGVGLLMVPLPRPVLIAAALYVAFIALYTLAELADGGPLGLVIASAAKLAIPVVLTQAGAIAAAHPRLLARVFLGFAIATSLFGWWDIRNTEFWAETLDYGDYLTDVKGIITGFEGLYLLPHNFFGFEVQRRAAGLVAAPLAQGSILALAALVALGVARKGGVVGWALVVLFAHGVYLSGTRGAMLMLLIALPLFVLLAQRGGERVGRNALMLAVLAGLSFETLLVIYGYTTGLEDGSTIGHVWAFERNLRELPGVLILGEGMGSAGSVAADLGLEIAGGGEGAIFSIIFQLGLPAGIVFLAFYGLMVRELLRESQRTGNRLALAVACFAIGAATSFIISDHMFAVSGMGPFWLIAGAILGGCQPVPRAIVAQA